MSLWRSPWALEAAARAADRGDLSALTGCRGLPILPTLGKGGVQTMRVKNRQNLCVIAACLLVATAGCQTLSSWGHGMRRQFERAGEEIKEDLSVLDDDYDGLDAFGPDAAEEMRAARADMMR